MFCSFSELSHKAGIPPGVINVITGSGGVAGQAIADHPLVRKLGFTGSTPVGKTIMKSCAVSNLKKASLELGGKSPLIIFGDFDLDKAVRTAMGACYFNKGENCIAAGNNLLYIRKIMVCEKWLMLDLLDNFENDNKSIINIELLEHHFFLTRQNKY